MDGALTTRLPISVVPALNAKKMAPLSLSLSPPLYHGINRAVGPTLSKVCFLFLPTLSWDSLLLMPFPFYLRLCGRQDWFNDHKWCHLQSKTHECYCSMYHVMKHAFYGILGKQNNNQHIRGLVLCGLSLSLSLSLVPSTSCPCNL